MKILGIMTGKITSNFWLVGVNFKTPLVIGKRDSFQDFISKLGRLSGIPNPNSDIFVCVDANQKSLVQQKKFGFSKSNSILIVYEPSVVAPLNYSKRVRKRFGLIIEVGRNPHASSHAVPWPQNWPEKVIDSIEPRISDRVALINADKLSFIAGENYSLRRQIVSYPTVDTYGHGWDEGFRRKFGKLLLELATAIQSGRKLNFYAARNWFNPSVNWHGPVKSKNSTLEKYKVSIVIENSSEFMSEKLFDSLFAGCIPVYVGPPISDFGVPENLIYQCEASPKSIVREIERALNHDYDVWASEAKKFLGDAKIREKHHFEKVFFRIVREIDEYLFQYSESY